MMVFDNKFDIGQKVYLKTDPEQQVRIVTAININPYDLLYSLTCGTDSSQHYDIEISDTKDILTHG